MTIQAIVKNTIKRLELENKLLTPEFYAEAFCKEAQKAGVSFDDCSQVDKYKKTLNAQFQKELEQYRIRTLGELIRYLISKLNRTQNSVATELLDAQGTFLKKVLQAVGKLHNKKATLLAKQSLDILDTAPKTLEYEQYKQLWNNFILNYDDSFLQHLGKFSAVDPADLQKTIENITSLCHDPKAASSDTFQKKAAAFLVASFVPSIASSMDDRARELSKKIKKDPKILQAKGMTEEIKTIISLRIALDKKSVTQMIRTLDTVLDKLSHRLIEMIERSDSSTEEIQKIKAELDGFQPEGHSNFKQTHRKLFTIAVALEENTKSLSQDLKKQNSEVAILGAKVQELEEELAKTKEQLKEDFLTKLHNKRALDEFLKQTEAAYLRYEHNYSIVMFDLDHFKQVNDTYGHEAGDAVLSAFASILKQECRNVDIVGRYGGEEFMAILTETAQSGATVFAEKVREHVQKARFLYKKQRIDVTVSCGVSERKHRLSVKDTINTADENLYQAKRTGRNQVVSS